MPVASGSLAFLGAARFQGYWNASTNAATGSGLDGAVSGPVVDLHRSGSSANGGYAEPTGLTASIGSYWQVTGSGAHNLDGHTSWNLNDWAIYSGSAAGGSSKWARLAFEDTIASIVIGDLSSSSFHMGVINDTHIIFASGSVHSGSSNFTYDYNSDRLYLTGALEVKGTEILLVDDVSTDKCIRITQAGDDGLIEVRANDVTKVTIHGNGDTYFDGGNVGIGTTVPLDTLSVTGTLGVSGNTTLGDTAADVTTVAGQLTASQGALFNNDVKIKASSFTIEDANSTDTCVKITTINDDGQFLLYANNLQTIKLDGNGDSYFLNDIQIGAAQTDVSQVSRFHIVSEIAGSSEMTLTNYSDSVSNGGGEITFRHASGSFSSYSTASADSRLGMLEFKAHTGVTWSTAAAITANVDGEIGTGGDTSDTPGRIELKTTSDGSGSPTTRMTIKNDGKIGIGTTVPLHTLSVTGTLGASGTATFAGAVSVGGTLTVDGVGVTAIQTNLESFVDNDTSLMTSAAIQDKIEALVTAEDLDVATDSGTAAVDLNSQSLTVTGGTGIDTSASGQAVTVTLDLTEVGVNGSANQLLTDDGDGTVTSEATLSYSVGDLTVKNISSSGTSTFVGGNIVLVQDDNAPIAADHNLGAVSFRASEDGSNTISEGARISAHAAQTWDGDENDGYLSFWTTNGETPAERLRIMDTGLVGIGTTIPLNTLSVTGTLGVSGLTTATSGIQIPANNFITFGTGSANRMDVGLQGITISGSGVRIDSSGAISLDASSAGTVLFQKDSVTQLSISSASLGPIFKPEQSGHGLNFATQGGDLAAAVDSASDGFGIYRKMILGGDALLLEGSSVLEAANPVNIIVCTGSGHVTGSLADPIIDGQLKVVVGLAYSTGRPILLYNNFLGAVEKQLSNQTGVVLYGFSNGLGGYKWIPVGDTS